MPPQGVILPPSAEEQRASFNSKFLPPNAKELRIEPPAYKAADETEKIYFEAKISLERRKALQGVEPATVLNMNPFPLEINSPLFGGLKVPACPIGQAFTSLVITETRYEVKQTVSGTQPVDIDPFFLAREFDTQYQEVGGVVVLRGSIEKDPEILDSGVAKQMLVESKRRAIENATKLKQEADSEWNTPAKGARSINDMHRNAARVLLHERLINELPPWISAARNPSEVVDVCPMCRVEPKKGAVICTCAYILDPAEAFRHGVVKEDHESLMRLSRKQLQELHITKKHIPETLEERDARMKKAAAEEEE